MSLSSCLQSQDILKTVCGSSPAYIRDYFIEKGMTWFQENPQETGVITANLSRFGIRYSAGLVHSIKQHIILHYFEKVLPVCIPIEKHHAFLSENVKMGNALEQLENARSDGKGVLLAVAHFGGVECIVPTLAMFRLPIHAALRYTTEHFSEMAHMQAAKMEESGLYGPIHIIEIGKPGSVTALEMAAVLRKKEIMVTVFDEKNEYSKPVKLLGKTVSGGSGLDKILRFTNTQVAVFNAFMVRGENHTYHLRLMPVDSESPDLIQTMYHNLEAVITENIAQWYYLHEEIPFITRED